VYTLLGKGSEPLAEGHILVECQVRNADLGSAYKLEIVLQTLQLALSAQCCCNAAGVPGVQRRLSELV
jgi:hypothetical protein